MKVCRTKDNHTRDKSPKSVVSGAYYLSNNIHLLMYVSYRMMHEGVRSLGLVYHGVVLTNHTH